MILTPLVDIINITPHLIEFPQAVQVLSRKLAVHVEMLSRLDQLSGPSLPFSYLSSEPMESKQLGIHEQEHEGLNTLSPRLHSGMCPPTLPHPSSQADFSVALPFKPQALASARNLRSRSLLDDPCTCSFRTSTTPPYQDAQVSTQG